MKARNFEEINRQWDVMDKIAYPHLWLVVEAMLHNARLKHGVNFV